jgi:hypothetical protein
MMKLLTALSIALLISVGIILPIWFMQAMDLQARIDREQADHALIARINR